MSERESLDDPHHCISFSFRFLVSPLKTILDSLAISFRSRLHLAAVFFLAALPLTLLLFSFSASAYPAAHRAATLESLARFAATQESLSTLALESRAAAVSVIRLRGIYFIPCLALSLSAFITAVTTTHAALAGKPPTAADSLAALRERWIHALVTSICVYSSMWGFLVIPGTLLAVVDSSGPRFAIRVIGWGVEVYLMAVLALGMVVSVVEEKSGWTAIRVGSRLMEGRRWSGWALSCLFAAVTGWIWTVVEHSMDGQDWSSVGGMVRWTVGIRRRAVAIPLYALWMLWSYVATTVFYWECRKRRNGLCKADSSELSSSTQDF